MTPNSRLGDGPTPADGNPPEVRHDSRASRFVVDTPQGLALCSYRRESRPQGDVLVLHHTEVPPALEGRGLAAAVVAATLAWARQEGLGVRPVCSYVAAYMRRHPETLDLLAPARRP